jgi:hypothetical protein
MPGKRAGRGDATASDFGCEGADHAGICGSASNSSPACLMLPLLPHPHAADLACYWLRPTFPC